MGLILFELGELYLYSFVFGYAACEAQPRFYILPVESFTAPLHRTLGCP